MSKRFEPSEELKALIEEVRREVKDVANDDYGYGVVDALAFVWAGMPKNVADEYGPVMGQFADLLEEAGL